MMHYNKAKKNIKKKSDFTGMEKNNNKKKTHRLSTG